MRVRHVVGFTRRDGSTGGVIEVALQQVGALNDSGSADADLVCLSDTSDDWVEQPHIHATRTRVLPGRLGLRTAFSRRFVRQAMEDAPDIDVFHIHLARDATTTLVARACIRSNRPFVLQSHGMMTPSDGRRMHQALDRMVYRDIWSRARCHIVLSEAESDATELKRPPAQALIPNFAPRVSTPTTPIRRWIFVGRIDQSKRPGLAVSSAGKTGLPIDVFGPSGTADRELQRALALNGAAVYHGPVPHDHVLGSTAESWGLILLSRGDPFPMAVVEALATGVPCIVDRTNGLAPMISRYGAGAVVDGEDEAAVTHALLALSSPLARDRASRAARSLVERELSASAFLRRIMPVYERSTERTPQ